MHFLTWIRQAEFSLTHLIHYLNLNSKTGNIAQEGLADPGRKDTPKQQVHIRVQQA